ncbi:ATP-binding protein [Streptomyces pathocidini]|uniref:ATP-binding protein n=1 Tax=Streptomyces pathocidini TaxID=1650571 RepID=A0ABW7UN28_9ACTN
MVGVSDTAGAPESTPPAPCAAAGESRVEWTFPDEPDAVRAARSLVRTTLNEWGLNAISDLAVLLVSELVTNAQRYATGPIGVCLRRGRGDALVVEVSDPLPELPLARDARPDDEGGRGLQLVARTSRRWGTRRGTSGKTVWFELVLPG